MMIGPERLSDSTDAFQHHFTYQYGAPQACWRRVVPSGCFRWRRPSQKVSFSTCVVHYRALNVAASQRGNPEKMSELSIEHHFFVISQQGTCSAPLSFKTLRAETDEINANLGKINPLLFSWNLLLLLNRLAAESR